MFICLTDSFLCHKTIEGLASLVVQGPYLATSDELFYNNFVSIKLVGY